MEDDRSSSFLRLPVGEAFEDSSRRVFIGGMCPLSFSSLKTSTSSSGKELGAIFQ